MYIGDFEKQNNTIFRITIFFFKFHQHVILDDRHSLGSLKAEIPYFPDQNFFTLSLVSTLFSANEILHKLDCGNGFQN